MKIFFGLILLSIPNIVCGQRLTQVYQDQTKKLQTGVNPSDQIDYNPRGYTLLLPADTSPVRGLLISLEDNKYNPMDSSQHIHTQANARGYAVAYISSGVPFDLFFSDTSYRFTHQVIKQILHQHAIPDRNIFFLGVSLAGHRALKYTSWLVRQKPEEQLNIQGYILCDGVLDWVRQWYEEKKAIRDSVSESSLNEGKLVTYLLEKNLGSTPKTGLEKYLQFSPYSYFDETCRYIPIFKKYVFRAYSEPATHYWQEVKGKTTFDTNFPDMVGIINELKLAGNTDAELVVFNQDKKIMDRRNPFYTWALVDKTELMEWIIRHSR